MIYRRRALQRRLNELRGVLDDKAVDGLARRLNRAGKDRVAAMWELVVLHGLSKCGILQNEVALPSGRRPDILFKYGAIQLIADITAASDDGLDQNNPFDELFDLIETAKNKLKLPVGGLDLQVRSRREQTKRGPRTVLRLPPRNQLQEFVSQRIVPPLREQMAAGKFPLRILIDDNDVGLDITIDPNKSPFGSGGFATYDLPTIRDRNPLYNSLKAKVEQLRDAECFTGIIVGDGDCIALSERPGHWQEASARQIVEEFFRQFSSVDFVLLLSVRESRHSWTSYQTVRQNEWKLFCRRGFEAYAELNSVFQSMIENFPKPIMMPVNGAWRARENDYDLGHHGGYSMSGSDVVCLGLRELTEALAGLQSFQDKGANYVEAPWEIPREANPAQAVILANLSAGRLPKSIEIIKTDENHNDDWVEIRFGEADPAISSLR